MATITLTLALDSDGTVDEGASLSACQAEIRKYKAARETEQEVIGEAVHAVFDSLAGAKANMPYVVNSALRALNAQPESFKLLSERVSQYIRDNAGEAGSGKAFAIVRGKGGGAMRWCDQAAPAPEAK